MKKFVLLSVFSFSLFTSSAQTGADYLKAAQRADVEIVFDLSDTGKEYKVNWGMDAAWDWDFNVKRGVAHIGKGNFATGRVSFQPNDLVTDNGDGTYSVDDLLGGWYCQRAGYGTSYAMEAVISIDGDGALTCSYSYVPGWGDGLDDFEGSFDAATSTFQFTAVYAGMDFVQTWVKE